MAGIAPRAILWAAAVASCYSPPQPACGFICGPAGACPASYTCLSDLRCHLDGAPAMPCDGDGGVVPTGDAPIHVFDGETGPAVASISPSDGTTGWPTSAGVAVDVMLTQPVMGVSASSFSLWAGGGAVPVTANVMELTVFDYELNPAFDLMPNTSYTVELTPQITNFDFIALAPFTSTFTTGSQ